MDTPTAATTNNYTTGIHSLPPEILERILGYHYHALIDQVDKHMRREVYRLGIMPLDVDKFVVDIVPPVMGPLKFKELALVSKRLVLIYVRVSHNFTL